MAIDKMGSRFYMQQMSKSSGGSKQPSRLKKDIVSDIEAILKLQLKSLMKVTNKTLEDIYDALQVCER